MPGELVAHGAQRADAHLGLGHEGLRLRAAVARGDGPRDETGLGEDGERRAGGGRLVETFEARPGLLADVVREGGEGAEDGLGTRAGHRRRAFVPRARRGFFAKSAGRFSTNARCASP